MYLHNIADYPSRANTLIRGLIDSYDPKYGLGSGTCSIYDTAWVSMVAKTIDGQPRWLFPSSFLCVLAHQQHDGGWQDEASSLDGILHSLAALLALCRHITHPHQINEDLEDLNYRKSRAIYFLETRFTSWHFDPSVATPQYQSGVSKLLRLLQREGIEFDFPSKSLFMLPKEPSVNYSKIITSTSEQGSHYKVCGSIKGSPASTAAYLMQCSTWDDEAEAYLSHIISIGLGRSAGVVPAKFPTTVFELSSVLAILMQNGFTHQDLGTTTLDIAAKLLEDCVRVDSGVIKFTPCDESDAVIIAKTISALCQVGQMPLPKGLVMRFDTGEYFETYIQDRNSSFVTNCDILKALLNLLPRNGERMGQIQKTVDFLCNYWWTTNGEIKDQSNVSTYYPIMLMVEAFTQLLDSWGRGYGPAPDDPTVRSRVFISLLQALVRVLQGQKANGSWGSGCEVTSYAIISLAKLSSLSSAPKLKLQVNQAIETGRKFLVANFRPFSEPDRTWRGDITSGNSATYQAFILAALRAPAFNEDTKPTFESYFEISIARVAIQTKYYARHNWFVNVPEWLMQASLLESYIFLPQLKDVRYAAFPSEALVEDRYFESIPFAWVVVNYAGKRYVGAEFLFQMMVLSMLNRQFESYMENVVGEIFAGCLFEIEDIIHGIFYEIEIGHKSKCYCEGHDSDAIESSTATTIADVRSVFYRLIAHILNHPYVFMASFQDQSRLRSELLSYLLRRIKQDSNEKDALDSADQTAHPYTYAFFACLVGHEGKGEVVGQRRDFLDTPEQQYLIADLCRHLSIISFMSVNSDEQMDFQMQRDSAASRKTRIGIDRADHASSRSVSTVSTTSSIYDDSTPPVSSISSVSSSPSNWASESLLSESPAYQHSGVPVQPVQESTQISRLLSYERRCLDLCLRGLLEAGVNQQTNDVLRLFVDAIGLSEQIFRDPNIGVTCEGTATHVNPDQVCLLKPPPLPPKRERGSVAAARAALSIESMTSTEKTPSASEQDHIESQSATDSTFADGSKSDDPVPMERDWSWNQTSSSRPRRTSRASSEVSRIESIMSAIDGIKLDINQEFASSIPMQKGIISEGDFVWTPSTLDLHTRRRETDSLQPDPEAIKLAKFRAETQHKLNQEAQKKAASSQKKLANDPQAEAMEGIHHLNQEAKRRATDPPGNTGWVKAPPPVMHVKNMDVQARKLHRASKWSGPKWKAPF